MMRVQVQISDHQLIIVRIGDLERKKWWLQREIKSLIALWWCILRHWFRYKMVPHFNLGCCLPYKPGPCWSFSCYDTRRERKDTTLDTSLSSTKSGHRRPEEGPWKYDENRGFGGSKRRSWLHKKPSARQLYLLSFIYDESTTWFSWLCFLGKDDVNPTSSWGMIKTKKYS